MTHEENSFASEKQWYFIGFHCDNLRTKVQAVINLVNQNALQKGRRKEKEKGENKGCTDNSFWYAFLLSKLTTRNRTHSPVTISSKNHHAVTLQHLTSLDSGWSCYWG